MAKPKVDFKQVKITLLKKSSEELSEFIRSAHSQDEAMFLFWALDYLDQHQGEIPKNSLEILKKNRDILTQAQDVVFRENLKYSLEQFSAGFVLGTLEFAIRDREAQIDRYEEYLELIAKIQTWPKLGFPNEQFKKYWEERINDIQEIQDWMKTRASDWFPIIIPLYRSGKFHKSSEKTLKALRKGRTDTTVFQILAALLHSNPILDQRIKAFCEENQISMVDKRKLMEIMSLLADKTTDKKVQQYCTLLLGHQRKKGDD